MVSSVLGEAIGCCQFELFVGELDKIDPNMSVNKLSEGGVGEGVSVGFVVIQPKIHFEVSKERPLRRSLAEIVVVVVVVFVGGPKGEDCHWE